MGAASIFLVVAMGSTTAATVPMKSSATSSSLIKYYICFMAHLTQYLLNKCEVTKLGSKAGNQT
jgi:hypothetical protein